MCKLYFKFRHFERHSVACLGSFQILEFKNILSAIYTALFLQKQIKAHSRPPRPAHDVTCGRPSVTPSCSDGFKKTCLHLPGLCVLRLSGKKLPFRSWLRLFKKNSASVPGILKESFELQLLAAVLADSHRT